MLPPKCDINLGNHPEQVPVIVGGLRQRVLLQVCEGKGDQVRKSSLLPDDQAQIPKSELLQGNSPDTMHALDEPGIVGSSVERAD